MAEFEWDTEKAADNIRKHHGIKFEKALEAFDDPYRIETQQDRIEKEDERWQVIGMSNNCLLFVAYASYEEDCTEIIRTISARKAQL